MTPALLLDTHEAINELAEAGMPEAQAAVLVRQQVKLLEGGLAGKSDIEDVRIDFEAEFRAFEAEFKAFKADVEAEFKTVKANIDAVKADVDAVKAGVETLRRETTEKIDAAVETLRRETAEKIDAAVETLRQETAAAINAAKLELVRWLIGAMIAGGIGIAGVVIAAIKIV